VIVVLTVAYKRVLIVTTIREGTGKSPSLLSIIV